jgi:PhzF family phenazine biosynthesis protein
MRIPIYQVDAFTEQLFCGNPAAVCPIETWLPQEDMQKIAAENNLSETAFFVKKDDKFEVRWFTPEIEIDLCGHATLAAAHVVFNHLDYDGNEIQFEACECGALTVTKSGDLLTLNFPATKPVPLNPFEAPIGLGSALGGEPEALYKSRDLLAVFKSEKEIVSLHPSFGMLTSLLEELDCLGMIVTAPGEKSDFVSRFFAPLAGIEEDPVTGSAHATLIPFWAEQLKKLKMSAFQLSKRKGELFCEMAGDRVLISGKAVTYLQGQIEI